MLTNLIDEIILNEQRFYFWNNTLFIFNHLSSVIIQLQLPELVMVLLELQCISDILVLRLPHHRENVLRLGPCSGVHFRLIHLQRAVEFDTLKNRRRQ